jgi:protein-S-isoprenylcysteine O-methyltransferase Ste14
VADGSETAAPKRDVRLSAHRRAEQFAAAIYGTIVAAGVLAVSSAAADDGSDALETAVYMVATVVVLWLAHAWAHTLGDRAVSEHEARELRQVLVHDLPLALSVLPALAALALASLFGASDERAIDAAIWVCAIVLGAAGAGIARREGASTLNVIGSAAGTAALGMVLVVLKAVVH